MNIQQLPKSYEPLVEEPKVLQRWESHNPFHADPTDPGQPFCILIPLPNITDKLHLGHALNNSLQDILTRYHRMKGFNTLWMPGTDHAGIATQTVVEKRILHDEGKRRIDFERDEFVARINTWKDEYQATILSQLREMGCSCDWDRTRFTMDDVCKAAVREAFFTLFKDGLIYRGKRLVNWDPATQTALADDEVEMHDIEGYFWYLQYPLIGEPVIIEGKTYDHVTVATTRPETMLGDTAVAMNPRDPRAAYFKDRKVRLPIVNREIPIIEDDYVVLAIAQGGDPEDTKAQYATGFLKVTPAHDPNDWEIGLRHNLPVINVLATDGTISDKFGWDDIGGADFTLNLDRYEAREAIVEWFRENTLLEEVKPYTHSVGHSYRSHVAIEPYLSDQWYVGVTKQIPSKPDLGITPNTSIPINSLAGYALRSMTQEQTTTNNEPYISNEPRKSVSGTNTNQPLPHGRSSLNESWENTLKFYPQRYAKTFQNWHENLRDWCISRQLWWGHRIPVWSANALPHEHYRPNDPDEFIPKILAWQSEGKLVFQDNSSNDDNDNKNINKDPKDDTPKYFICIRSEDDDPAMIEFIEAAGFKHDPDVLDTWFSSALWPMSTMGWPDPDAFPEDIPEGSAVLEKWNPTSVLCTAREIITLWVSRMVMFNVYFMNRLPYRDVFIHAMIQDGDGRKMSKSLGNGVDPRDIIKTKGTDAMRFTLAHMTTQTQDVRMPVIFDEELGTNTSPKFEIGKRLCNKLWNATRFTLTTLSSVDNIGDPDTKPNRLIDRWIMSRLCKAITECETAIAEYQFNAYAQTMYDLFWRDFCDWYLEAIKPTIKQDATQQAILRVVLSTIHRMFQPVIPFITETLHESIESLKVKPHSAINLGSSEKTEFAALASWPVINDKTLINVEIEAEFERVRELVTAIREVRASHNVPDKRLITLHIVDANTIALIQNAQGIVQALAGLDKTASIDNLPSDAVKFTFEGSEHSLSNLLEVLDQEAENLRINKRITELDKLITTLQNRLNNKGYTDKAPANLVNQTRIQLNEAQEELNRLQTGITQ